MSWYVVYSKLAFRPWTIGLQDNDWVPTLFVCDVGDVWKDIILSSRLDSSIVAAIFVTSWNVNNGFSRSHKKMSAVDFSQEQINLPENTGFFIYIQSQ